MVAVWGLGCGGSAAGGDPDAGGPTGGGDGGEQTATPRVLINEVVTSPVNDWNDSAGDDVGTRFDGTPGTGLVSTDDEYIELYNAGDETVNLIAYTLELVDDSTVEMPIGAIGTVVVGQGSTLSAVKPGGYVVIGDPVGTLSNDLYLVLRDGDGQIVDDLEIGGLTEGRDMEGDGVGDGAPGLGDNGFARGSFDEAVARSADSIDTDDDQSDFGRLRGTPLGPNVAPSPPDEEQPPQVMNAPVDAVDFVTTELVRIEFDETIDATTVPGQVRLTVDGDDLALGHYTFENRDNVLVVNPIGRLPYGATVEVSLSGGSEGIADLAGNRLEDDVTFTFTTEAPPSNPGAVVINEVCVSPVQDWGNSSGGDGMAFTGMPGSGVVSSLDEWIELLVLAPGPIDMTDYQIIVYNGPNLSTPSRVDTSLSSDQPVVRVTGSGDLGGVVAGDRIVVGNPRGAMLPATFIELRDGAGALVDAIEIGGNTPLTDRGGDGVANGAPEAGSNGNSTGLGDETVARVPDGADTGDDIADFAHARATIGKDN